MQESKAHQPPDVDKDSLKNIGVTQTRPRKKKEEKKKARRKSNSGHKKRRKSKAPKYRSMTD